MGQGAVALTPAGIERIHTAMNRYISEGKVPGMLLAVEQAGQRAYFDCLGKMAVESQQAMQPDTIFRIASMTKPIISVAVLMLEEAGRLRLDDPLSKYIPEFADAQVFVRVTDGHIETEALKRPISLYHLMTHTSGLCSFHPDPLVNDMYQHWHAQDVVLAEKLRQLARLPLAHQPGEGWIYGESHDVLGHIIELVTGMPLDSALTQMIFVPLGMVDTDFHVSTTKASRLAALYQVDQNRLDVRAQPHDAWPFARPVGRFSGGGGLLSTASDYLRFARMLLNKGELEGVRLLKPETVERMTTNQLEGRLYPLRFGEWESKGEGYGLGVGILVEPAVSILAGAEGTYTWSGSYSTHFWVDPQNGIIGLLLAQFEPMFFHPIHAEFRALVYQALSDS